MIRQTKYTSYQQNKINEKHKSIKKNTHHINKPPNPKKDMLCDKTKIDEPLNVTQIDVMNKGAFFPLVPMSEHIFLSSTIHWGLTPYLPHFSILVKKSGSPSQTSNWYFFPFRS